MANHNDLGKNGEATARDYLLSRGYDILAINWRFGRAEIDLIARQDDILVFVEVKTRSSGRFGDPATFLSALQEGRLTDAAGVYMESVGYDGEIRFDVIGIVWSDTDPPLLEHIEDAFFTFE